MLETPIQRAMSATILSLMIFAVCVAAFIPPVNHTTLSSLPLTILAGMGIGVSMILHFVFVGITATRMGRSPLVWVALSLITFPLGSVIGLILLGWSQDEKAQTLAQDQ